jgi:hypothetical protein
MDLDFQQKETHPLVQLHLLLTLKINLLEIFFKIIILLRSSCKDLEALLRFITLSLAAKTTAYSFKTICKLLWKK